MALLPILWRSSLRHLSRHPWQAGLAVTGVALGVAVVVAIDLANQSAEAAFELSTETVTGRTTHQILGGPSGLPDALYRSLVLEAGIDRAAPVVEAWATAEMPGGGRRTLHLLGVDPFAEAPFRSHLAAGRAGGDLDLTAFLTRPGAAVMVAETARALGAEAGGELEIRLGGRAARVVLTGSLETGDKGARQALADLLLVDVATAQELLDRPGVLSHVDLILPEGAEGERREAAVRALLPAEARLVAAGTRTAATAEMTRAFRLNLRALSLLALVCGAFLVFNTMSFSVVERRGLLGRLRALGVTRKQVFRLILAEAAALGAAGAILGTAGGIALAHGLVRLVSRTINDLYFTVNVRSVEIEPASLAAGAALALGASLAAALAPALEATSAPPRRVMARAVLEASHRRAVPRLAAAGAGLMAAGAGLLAPRGPLWVAFTGLLLAVLGMAIATPAASVVLLRALRPAAGALFGLLGRMAARGVEASLSRTAVAIAALTVAVSVTVGVGTMIASFRLTVVRWLEGSLAADVYLSAATTRAGSLAAPLPRELAARIAAVEGVEGVTTVRVVEIPAAAGPTRLVAFEPGPRRDASGAPRGRGFALKKGDPQEVWRAFEEGAALVSEPFAFRRGVGVGSRLELPTPEGERSFEVAGIYYDYGSDQGAVLLHDRFYQRLWRDEGLTGIAAFAAPGVDLERLAEAMRRAAGDEREVVVRSNRRLREASIEVFDRTFLITSVLRMLAGAVAFLGVLGALMALQLERARELGVLRANGLTPSQLWRLVTAQTGLMGLVSGLLSIPVGLALAWVMIHVINQRSFGWSLEMTLTPAIPLQALALSLGAALLAGIYPARRMASTPPAAALRRE